MSADLSDILTALDTIPPGGGREDWWPVLAALKAELGDAGRDIAESWSQQADNYTAADFNSTWNSLNGSGGITIATLFRTAKLNGWTNGKPPAQRPSGPPIEAPGPAHEIVALKCAKRWKAAEPADLRHPYLVAKGIPAAGARQEGVNLLLPMQDKAGRLGSLQTIAPDGKKLFTKDSKTKGLFMILPGDDRVRVVCEGYATGVSINKETGYRTLVAFSCHNLAHVARMEREGHPGADIVIAADRLPETTLDKARKVASEVRARLAVPECEGSDFNDMALEGGDVKLSIVQSEAPGATLAANIHKYMFDGLGAILGNLSTPEWIIRDYLERGTHVLVYGESESCKSFVALDMGLSVAAGIDWNGEPVKQGPVFYICGEGKGGIDRRIAAWAIRNNLSAENIPFFRSRRATRFYDEGAALSVAKAINELAEIHGPPALVIIDTLAKNLGADENSNKDIGQYFRHIDIHIMQRFGCSALTVHHVGHGDKSRARGAYALKADFDADIMIERDKDDTRDEVRFIPGKMKDAEPARPLAFIPCVVDLGLVDEWGRQVNSLVMDSTEYTRKSVKQGLGKAQQQALDILNDMMNARRKNLERDGRDPDLARVELQEWKKELEDKGALGPKPSKQRWYTLRDGLLNRGLVVKNGVHVKPAGNN